MNQCSVKSITKYYCYLMELKQNFDYKFPVHNIMLLVRSQLKIDDQSMGIELEVDRGILTVNLKSVGLIRLNSNQVLYLVFMFLFYYCCQVVKIENIVMRSYFNIFPLFAPYHIGRLSCVEGFRLLFSECLWIIKQKN